MMRRWPVASGAATAAATGVIRLEDAATNGSARARLGCGCRSDQSAAAKGKTENSSLRDSQCSTVLCASDRDKNGGVAVRSRKDSAARGRDVIFPTTRAP